MNDKWRKWATMTEVKHEKYKEKRRPTETKVQAKLDKKKGKQNGPDWYGSTFNSREQQVTVY